MQPSIVSQQLVDGLFSAYARLKEKDRDRINLAIQRMLRARCQQFPGNRAIDLAIALEVLFMNAERDEHSYKISLRVARSLRNSLDERRTVFASVRKLYDMRSSMVHGGSASNTSNVNGVQTTGSDLVEFVDVICTESIRKFLSLGGIPEEWRNIELGCS